MIVTSKGIVDGVILDKYGKRGTQFDASGAPNLSLPIDISGEPIGTKSFALVIEDMDAYPVTKGFTWFHWLAANITTRNIPENASLHADFVQGVNSTATMQGGSQSIEAASYYEGMEPPDQAHTYDIHVYALDCMLELENGFYLNELHHQMKGHVLAESVLHGIYEA